MAGHSGGGTVDFVRKGALLVLLTLAMLGIHQFALPPEGFEVRGLFALGYIILAAYTVGELAEVIKLPHITGYLLAGLVLGPSVAHLLVGLALPPPLDHGILNQNVVDQLVLLDDLALALIALTAGGELKLDELRHGIKQIAGVLAGQAVTIAVGVVLFLVAALSVAPQLLPPVAAAGVGAIIALGGVVASISFATSPAATIAVINSTGAKGPVAKTVLSAVILKDVLVVIAFSATMAVATGMMGLSTDGGFLLSMWHIAQSILLGVAIGGLLHLYLRFIGAELLLFLVGVIYTTTFIAQSIHAEAALVFIVAGIVVSNFSDRGETLIHEVERLSMPVYVVFFTLAGAKLHLDELWAMLPLALGLVVVRILALVAGVRAGAQLTGADPNIQRYGWMGFVSQAGLAITLATQMKDTFPGGIGEAMFSVLLGGVAINEMLGPVLLQTGLGLAGEVRDPHSEELPDDDPTAQATLPSVPGDLDLSDPFGEPLETGVGALDRSIGALQADLQVMVRDRTWGPMMEIRRDADAWLRQLRRDLLRVQRSVANKVATIDDDAELATAIRHGVGALGERWRTHVLSLAARIPRQDRWSPRDVVDGVDAHVDGLQVMIPSPILDASLASRPENVLRQVQRRLLRVRHRLKGEREVNLRDLARYHLSGEVPSRMEGVAALMVDTEMQLASHVQALFEDVADRWEGAAHALEAGGTREEVADLLGETRNDADEAIDLLSEQLEAASKEGVARAAAVVGWGVRRLKEDVAVIGTFDLPHRSRSLRKVFPLRNQGQAALGPRLVEARKTVSARYAQLALELELVGLEGRIQDAVQVHGTQLERLVRGRGPKQLELVEEALGEWLDTTGLLVNDAETAGPVSKGLRTETEPLVRRLQDARKAVEQLRQDLSDESWLGPLLDQLHLQAQGLTPYYAVPSRPPVRGAWTLPPPVPTTEIPFQELATQVIEIGVTRDLLDLTGDIASRIQELAAVLDEVERVVTFNVDLALAELDVVDEDAPLSHETRELVRAMVAGAVGRSHVRLQKLAVSAGEHAEGVRSSVQAAVIGRFERLHQQILDGQLGQLRLDVLRDAALGGTLARAGQWTGLLPEGRRRLGAVLERTLGRDRIASLSDALGLPDDHDAVSLRDALSEPEPNDDVPVVYRRLFADHALEGTDLLSGRSEALGSVRRVLSESQRRLRSIAVVSVDGQASRALVNTALRTFQGPVIRLEADRPWSSDDVEEWLQELPANDACLVIEGLRWLYRRAPGGTCPLERLVRAMVADGGRRAWILHADPAVWSYLTGATALGEATGEQVQLEALSADELEDAVLARHAMSGYTASFGEEDDLPLLTRVLGRRDRERRRQREWFQALHEASAGVLQDALRLWMAAIDRVDEDGGALHLGTVPRPPVAQLAELPDETLLTLVQVLRQGWMDAEQHAWLFRIHPERADAHLAQLVHLGLLEEQGPRVQVHPHLRGPLERALRIRGWA